MSVIDEEIVLLGTITAIQPEEVRMLQRVYKSLLREEWFDGRQKNECDFARVIIDFFQRGIRDEERLFAESLAVARSRFSKAKRVEPQEPLQAATGGVPSSSPRWT